jgi:gluconokinase
LLIKPTILVLMGVTGSGKTTVGQLLAEDLGWKFFDADDFHPEANIEKMQQGVPLDDDDREPWLMRLRELISDCLAKTTPAVLACSALKESYRKTLMVDARVEFVYLKGDLDLIKARLDDRSGHYMNPVLLGSQFEALEEPEDTLGVDVSLAPSEIVRLIKEHFAL